MPTIDNKRQTLAGQLQSLQLRMANQVQTKSWRDMLHAQHDRAFTVAGAMQADLLADLAKAVDDSISKGLGLGYFRKQFDKIVEQYGWAYKGERRWRTRVIYGTNMRVSYAAGRLVQLRDPELQKLAPFWMYRHSGAEHPRLQHKAWDKLALPADDPWFKTHYPPNGWGCGCRVVAVSARDIARMGGRIEIPPEGTDGIDEGWDYMPGGSVTDELQGVVNTKAAQLPPTLAEPFKADADARLIERMAIEHVVRQGIKEQAKRTEFAVLIKDGRRIIDKRGGQSEVSFSDDELAQFEGGLLVHNHPLSSSLSIDDLVLAQRGKLNQIIAAGNDGTVYKASRFAGDLVAARKQAKRLAQIAADRGDVDINELNLWLSHLINALMARKGVMIYERIGTPVPEWLTKLLQDL